MYTYACLFFFFFKTQVSRTFEQGRSNAAPNKRLIRKKKNDQEEFNFESDTQYDNHVNLNRNSNNANNNIVYPSETDGDELEALPLNINNNQNGKEEMDIIADPKPQSYFFFCILFIAPSHIFFFQKKKKKKKGDRNVRWKYGKCFKNNQTKEQPAISVIQICVAINLP